MRPIKLHFAAINSYRKQQVVDFEKLGADGLFGIFGPTGSGKSTILDAVSLALYGGIDRASNNTRGIIHQLETKLEVSFEFELGFQRYLVERRFNRNPKDPEAAMAKYARLRKLDTNEEVLASKPQEVTAVVERILGISKIEFSRAVVLPQGKFDQFLRMTGGDRAAMLEHLFNLGQYGDELVTKVKNEKVICTEQLQRIEGEAQGLGDCSEEAVNQAIMDLKTKNDNFGEVQKAFEDAEKSYKDSLTIGGLVAKRKAAEDINAELKKKDDSMKEKQLRLDAADRADPLREIINRQKELNKRIIKGELVYKEKSESQREAVNNHEKAKNDLDLAEKTFTEQSPQLQEKRAEYKGSLSKRQKQEALQKNADKKRIEQEEITKEISTLKKQMDCYQNDLDNVKDILRNLQENRSKYMVNPEEKEVVDQAINVLLRLEESEKSLDEKKQSYIDHKSKNEGQWVKLLDMVHELLPEKDVIIGDSIEEWTNSLVSNIETEIEKARDVYQHVLIQNSAAKLVKKLQKGEPCPVCGSREHPQPAKASQEIDNLEASIKALEKRLREVRCWVGKVLRALSEWKTGDQLVQQAKSEMETAQNAVNRLLSDFEENFGSFDREKLHQRKQKLTQFEKKTHKIDQEREKLLKTQEELNIKLQKSNGALQDIKSKEATTQETLKNIKIQIADISGELQQISGGKNLTLLIMETEHELQQLQKSRAEAKQKEQDYRTAVERLNKDFTALEATLEENRKELKGIESRLTTGLDEAGFAEIGQAESALLPSFERQKIREELDEYQKALVINEEEIKKLNQEIGDREFDEALFTEIKKKRQELFEATEKLKADVTLAKNKVEELQKKQARWKELQKQKVAAEKRRNLAEELIMLLRGRKFVSFLAQEHLRDMALEASYQLGRLTGQRYALELSKDKDCEFVIRDDFNGGSRRPINSLSGGEIFLTSLALALALSSKIQLRGKYPLGFFFLDEGFGTLDDEKLDKVMNALEKLHDRNRMVGIISHVRELKERMPRYLEVVPAKGDGSGSEVRG